MPMKLLLESAGPGRGILHVERSAEFAESVSLAIQRNNGRYLGPDQDWQPTPYWHPQFNAEPDTNGLRIELGPALMNGIISMQGAPLMLFLRIDGQEDRGVVRVRGTLIGSDAAALSSEEPTQILTGAKPLPSRPSKLDEQHDPVPDHIDPDSQGALKPQGAARRRSLALLAVVSALVLMAITAILYFDLPQRLLARTGTAALPTEQTNGPAGGSPLSTFAPSPESALTGRQFVVAYLEDQPSAEAMLAEAESRSEAGDCDAALLLYSRAAEADPALGLTVARLFDTATYVAGGCIDVASEETALEYYRSAAEAGQPEAMRRAGEILTRDDTSGPLYEEGVDWLRRAESTYAQEQAEDT